MNKLNQTSKLIIVAAVIIVVIGIVAAYYGGLHNGMQTPVTSLAPNSGANTPGGTASTSSTPSGTVNPVPRTSETPSGGTAAAPKAPTVLFVSPVPGDTWTINTPDLVEWSPATKVNGVVELLNASTFSLVGVILPVAGPAQTSYIWNTRDLFQSPTSPVKTTVTPGRYVVRIVFNGNHVPTITSQPFNIAN